MNSKDENSLIFLGSGTSTGVPIPGCSCSTCLSNNQKNKRLRSSVFITSKQQNKFIIDTGPDLRAQLLEHKINHIDFVLLTHDHTDHIGGIDDLRALTFMPKKRTIPVFCHPIHIDRIKNKFDYIFKQDELFNEKNPYIGGGLPLLDLHPISDLANFFPNENISWELAPHGSGQTMILFHDQMTYLIDCHEINTAIQKKITKRTTLIIDCVKIGTHPSHLGTDQTFDIIVNTCPKVSYLTHIGHDLDHDHLTKLCHKRTKTSSSPAYDGLKITYD
jgi:phosphoribosyl 1,2-cyclic phosphate phosphodiesterase